MRLSASGRRRRRRRRRRQRRARRVKRRTRKRRSARLRQATRIEHVPSANEQGDLLVTPIDSYRPHSCCPRQRCVWIQLAALLFVWISLCTVPSGEQRVLGVMGQAWWSLVYLKYLCRGSFPDVGLRFGTISAYSQCRFSNAKLLPLRTKRYDTCTEGKHDVI